MFLWNSDNHQPEYTVAHNLVNHNTNLYCSKTFISHAMQYVKQLSGGGGEVEMLCHGSFHTFIWNWNLSYEEQGTKEFHAMEITCQEVSRMCQIGLHLKLLYMEGAEYLLGNLKNNDKQKLLTCFNRMNSNRLRKPVFMTNWIYKLMEAIKINNLNVQRM
jgi:hypothetical protein